MLVVGVEFLYGEQRGLQFGDELGQVGVDLRDALGEVALGVGADRPGLDDHRFARAEIDGGVPGDVEPGVDA